MLNIGNFTGKTEEVASALRKRPTGICALQKTKRSGSENCNIERKHGKNGHKLIHSGSPCTQYGVGIAISEVGRDVLKEVGRFDDQLTKVTIITADCPTRFFTTYGPQTDRPDGEKDAFWETFNRKCCNIHDGDPNG